MAGVGEEQIISLSVINSTAPYLVQFKDNQSYVLQFCTDRNLVYQITFVLDKTLGLPDIFQFVIEEISGLHASYDVKIEKTIISILNSFFSNTDAVLSFVCDTKDAHEKARNQLFDRWFLKYNHQGLIKMDGVIHTEDTVFYSSLIYSVNNSNIEQIQSSFVDLIAELQK